MRFLALALAVATLLPGCSSTPTLPPISTTGERLAGKIVWHDLLTHDLEAASRFYSGLFGRTFESVSGSYGQFKNGDHLVGGIAEVNPDKYRAFWVPLMSVADVDVSSRVIQVGLPPRSRSGPLSSAARC